MLSSLPLLLALVSSPQQEDRAVFRVAADVVRVDVFVGRNGRAVPGLGTESFELFDDGALQSIASVGVESIPLNVFLALDVSQSVAGETLERLRSAAAAFLAASSENDRVALLTFSHRLELHSDLTSDRRGLELALRSVEAGGATSWHDALFATLELLEPVRERPMVLLFTDGADTYSWLSSEEMLPLVKRSSAVVYAITRAEEPTMPDLRTRSGRAHFRAARKTHGERTALLRELTEESGGRLLEIRSSLELREIFLDVLQEMKTRYVLTYSPRQPLREGWHELLVKVKERGVDVHARRGYYYAAER